MHAGRLGMLALPALLAACEVGPDYVKPSMSLPSGWTQKSVTLAEAAASAPKLRAWWVTFDDPMLNQLVDSAIAGNYDLKITRQRLVAARAERIVAGAAGLPQVDFGAQAALANSSTTLQWPPGVGSYRIYAFGFDASWELDIFGGTRRAEEAADADIGTVVEDRRAILVSLLAELATDYVTLRATQVRMGIAQRNVGVARQTLQLTTTAFDRGLTNNLATAQAQAQLDTVQAAIPPLHAQLAQMTHAIAVLLGQIPGALEAQLSRPAPAVPLPPELPGALPSEVVANRPDVRRAERRLAAASARIGVAVAQLYPHFTIPLTLMPTTSFLSETFQAASLVWSAGLTLTQTVYDGGKLSARVAEARAAAEEDRLAYAQTVLQALREVEDSLIAYEMETQRNGKLHKAVFDSRTAYDRAQRLYSAGLTDFLDVLTAERTLYGSEDEAALSDLARVRETVALYKALGGGWQTISFGDEDDNAMHRQTSGAVKASSDR
jgi:NodT family efflux transporter outer membrane factor (OMF) lipoprotein